MWLTDHLGKAIYRLVKNPPPDAAALAAPAFPRRLSESGLFRSVADHTMAEGVLPYSVNAQLWSDGAYKERYLALPHRPDEDCRIGYTGSGGWNFPNGTVLIKSFALETASSTPGARRWIETRFLVRQQNEWAGYSYAWNDEGNDATLVDAQGADRQFDVPDSAAADGGRMQSWHFPSRAECMTCHSRAANFVLGLQTGQMNRDHDYGGAVNGGPVDNQLRVLERLGLLRVNWAGETWAAQRKALIDLARSAAGDKAFDPQTELRIGREADEQVARRFASRDQRPAPKESPLLPQAPENLPRFVDPLDRSAPLAQRAARTCTPTVPNATSRPAAATRGSTWPSTRRWRRRTWSTKSRPITRSAWPTPGCWPRRAGALRAAASRGPARSRPDAATGQRPGRSGRGRAIAGLDRRPRAAAEKAVGSPLPAMAARSCCVTILLPFLCFLWLFLPRLCLVFDFDLPFNSLQGNLMLKSHGVCISLSLLAVAVCTAGSTVSAGPPVEDRVSKWEGHERRDFQVAGRSCLLIVPEQPAAGKPWIWRTEFFGHEPQADLALIGKGFHVAYIDVQNMYGAPVALDLMDAFYRQLTDDRGLSRRPVLEGFSRGGLFSLNWAARHPDQVACIYNDAPVCDFKSWPGGRGRGQGSPGDWRQCLEVYKLTEAEALAYKLNPVDNLAPLAKAKIPLLHVCGDADDVVPIDENTRLVEKRYLELGGPITVIAKPGVGHHPHSLVDPTPIVDFVLKHTAGE